MLPITCHWQSRFREIRWWGNFKRSSCRSDTLVFSGSQTCGILLFRTRAESSFGEQKVKDSDRVDWREWLEFEGDVISSLFAQTESALTRRWRSRHENGYHKSDG